MSYVQKEALKEIIDNIEAQIWSIQREQRENARTINTLAKKQKIFRQKIAELVRLKRQLEGKQI
jgi:peptidoglycan hydrolase CwlO-like protein